jgi:nucleoside-diphosphate-sugar epimerase
MEATVVTGATGFIGSKVCQALAGEPGSLIAVGRSKVALGGLRKKLLHINPLGRFHSVTHDLRYGERHAGFPTGLRYRRVIHCASPVPKSGAKQAGSCPLEEEALLVTRGLKGLLERCPPIEHLILLSSVAVYDMNCITAGRPTESTELTSAFAGYGASKREAEKVCEEHARSNCTNLTILRLSQVFGPNEPHGLGVSMMVRDACAGKAVVLQNAGEDVRDLLYVDDLVRIIRIVVKEKIIGTFNVGTGSGSSMRAVAAAIREALQGRVPVVTLPREREPSNTTVSNARLMERLPGFSFTPLSVGIARCCEEEMKEKCRAA